LSLATNTVRLLLIRVETLIVNRLQKLPEAL